LAWGGLFAGLPLGVLARGNLWEPAWLNARVPGSAGTVGHVIWVLSELLLASAYVGALLVLLEHEPSRRRLRWLAPVGRMGLTNYVAQGMLIATIWYGYGLGMQGKFGSLTGLIIAIGFFALQVVYSNWWLARFQYGPLEWLWRRLTYSGAVTLRRTTSPIAPLPPASGR
jgi:uncharacterized protein